MCSCVLVYGVPEPTSTDVKSTVSEKMSASQIKAIPSFHHLPGPTSLGNTLDTILAQVVKEKRETYLIFDFDRTLTNGFANPNEELPLERRIRGGGATLEALKQCKAHKELIHMYIITARSPTALTLQQLEASMTNCQEELAAIFLDSEEKAAPYQVEKFHEIQLAFKGTLYASDYSKSTAIRHLLTTKPSAETIVHFFDDFVGNAFYVGISEYPVRTVKEVHAYWWDTFQEEQLGLIGPVTSFSSDFPYQDGTIHARKHFGLSDEESQKQKVWYLEHEKKNNIKPVIKIEAPPIQKLDLKAFQGLGFGGNRKQPPAPPSPGGT